MMPSNARTGRGAAVLASAALVLLLPAPGGSSIALAAAAAAPAIAPPAIELEPRALGILKGACDTLAAAKTVSFKAVVAEESPSRLGPPLLYSSRYQVVLQRPDKLRILSPGDGPATEFYYDGKSMAAFAPKENYIARADAPPTIDAALDQAFTRAQIYYPFMDLLDADPYKNVLAGLRVAFYIGESESVGGVKTYMVAYANDHAFVQAWIGVDDKLPRRMRAIYRKDPAMLRHDMDINDWKLGAPLAAGTFAVPEAAKKALPIPFDRPDDGAAVAEPAPKP
ncbi:MAG: DUF2092 domain-containing protein [Steroidobacteraceae bacterium]|nr:DUF2092 domain-containing protein [Steroidobacteraceae bacterium]